MINLSAITHFFSESSLITYIVLAWLSIYFILSFTILFARLTSLSVWTAKEKSRFPLRSSKSDSGSLRRCTLSTFWTA